MLTDDSDPCVSTPYADCEITTWFSGMISEEELENARNECQEDDDNISEIETITEDAEFNGILEQESQETLAEVMNEIESSDSTSKKHYITDPKTGHVIHKVQLVSQLAQGEKISSDRLSRIKNCKNGLRVSDGNGLRESNEIGLFDNVAFRIDSEVNIGMIMRMRKQGQKSLIEYIRPIDLSNLPEDVTLVVQLYEKKGNDFVLSEQVTSLLADLVLCKINLESTDNVFRMDPLVLHSLFTQEERPHHDQYMESDGRIYESSVSRYGRVRRTIKYIC